MPLINVIQPPGQSVEEKRDLLRALTDAYVQATSAHRDSVGVTILETPREDWAVGGQTLAERAAGAR